MLQQNAITAQDLQIVYKKYSCLKKNLAQIFKDKLSTITGLPGCRATQRQGDVAIVTSFSSLGA
jgi:hypothetical protein